MTAAAVPQPMAVDGQVAHDPTSRSLLVKAKAGYSVFFWRRGHQAMLAAIESGRYYDAPTVWVHSARHREIARGVPEQDAWLRFRFRHDDPAYEELAAASTLGAIVTVDRAGAILGVRFRNRD